jgi:hypothetical protein
VHGVKISPGLDITAAAGQGNERGQQDRPKEGGTAGSPELVPPSTCTTATDG